jgi:hypothetical protein
MLKQSSKLNYCLVTSTVTYLKKKPKHLFYTQE